MLRQVADGGLVHENGFARLVNELPEQGQAVVACFAQFGRTRDADGRGI